MQNEILWKIYFGKISFHKIALQIWVFNKNKLSHKPFREGFWPQIQNSQIEEGRTPNFGEYLEVTLTHSLTLTLSNANSPTTWKVFKYGVISGPCFPVFGLNTKSYSVRTRNNSVFGPFLRSVPKCSCSFRNKKFSFLILRIFELFSREVCIF